MNTITFPYMTYLPDPTSLKVNWSEEEKEAIFTDLSKIMTALNKAYKDDHESPFLCISEVEDFLGRESSYSPLRTGYNLCLMEYLLNHPKAFENSQLIENQHALIFRAFAIHSLASDLLGMFATEVNSHVHCTQNQKSSIANHLISLAKHITFSESSLELAQEVFKEATSRMRSDAVHEKPIIQNPNKPLKFHEREEEKEPVRAQKKPRTQEPSKRETTDKDRFKRMEEVINNAALKRIKYLCEETFKNPSAQFSEVHVATAEKGCFHKRHDKSQMRLQVYLRALLIELHLNNKQLFKDGNILQRFQEDPDTEIMKEIKDYSDPIFADFFHFIQFGTQAVKESMHPIAVAIDLKNQHVKWCRSYSLLDWLESLEEEAFNKLSSRTSEQDKKLIAEDILAMIKCEEGPISEKRRQELKVLEKLYPSIFQEN